MKATEQPSELVVAESGEVVAPSAQGASASLETYLEIQRVFDLKMPDCIMPIQDKKFRKKAYWRAIATAFNVSCEVVRVEQVEFGSVEGGDFDWGFTAIARATTTNGRISESDGTCMASEKYGGSCTVHNVRSHAVTRAKNRAISDLVGFGEVSADELPADAFARQVEGVLDEPTTIPHAPTQQGAVAPTGGTLTKARIKQLGVWRAGFKASEEVHGKSDEDKWKSINWALDRMGFDKVDQVDDDRGDELIETIGQYPASQRPPTPGEFTGSGDAEVPF